MGQRSSGNKGNIVKKARTIFSCMTDEELHNTYMQARAQIAASGNSVDERISRVCVERDMWIAVQELAARMLAKAENKLDLSDGRRLLKK